MKIFVLLPFVLVAPLLGNNQVQPLSPKNETLEVPLAQSTERDNWIVVNDTVMGGRSSARLLPDQQGLRFVGELSLENNGGFSSIRRIDDQIAWQSERPIWLKVQGDGRQYQFRLRTDKTFDGIAYSAVFQTREGETTLHKFEPNDFAPQWRGRRVIGAAPLAFSDITQLGILLGDKDEGRFELVLQGISQ